MNPAHTVSRDFLLNDLVKSLVEVWFEGPTFLTLTGGGWPHFTIGDKFNLVLVQKKEKCKIDSVYNKDTEKQPLEVFYKKRFS